MSGGTETRLRLFQKFIAKDAGGMDQDGGRRNGEKQLDADSGGRAKQTWQGDYGLQEREESQDGTQILAVATK